MAVEGMGHTNFHFEKFDFSTSNHLCNDVDADVPALAPREIVKKSTSSKKTDAAPASADKSKARNNRPQPTGNEAAIKDKSAGRSANKAKGVEEAKPASRRPAKGGKTDRHSKTGKTDSEKKIKQAGWKADGEAELEAETEGAKDAAEEAAAAVEEAKPAGKSLEEYLNEKTEFVGTQREGRKVEAIEGEVVVKADETFIAATKTKAVKSKALKQKTFLDFDATFADEAPRERAPSTRGNSKPTRGGRAPRGAKAPRGTKAPRAPKAPAGPSINDEASFPSLA
ncbi:hypothetical protein WICPIJ_001881 [Wickerhamomyces pijperi]|uniref:Stm1-like N-terminal domain-containing protein n=1 Tax=Wickerhamomyces pijperi TaxID=599730 RepID=A0A9P8TQQ1_WICPI|nr:hypothetical protein WICPIJ_001881 [Wickerhamomyces pijperi]